MLVNRNALVFEKLLKLFFRKIFLEIIEADINLLITGSKFVNRSPLHQHFITDQLRQDGQT